jgi:GT2 family glycosyltransferase
MTEPRLGVAIVTMGDRPQQLAALLASVSAQDVAPVRIVLVAQAAELTGYDASITVVELAENLGCPGGRNVAMARLREFGDIDVIIELDDDGLLPDTGAFRAVRDRFAGEPRLGVIGFRVADENGETQRRHVPRLGAADPMRGGLVTAFLGGGHAFAVPMLEQIGDWPAHFFFGHEETDLAWRALDAGWHVRYTPDIVLQHPKTSPTRHAVYYRNNARNRVWLARRRLPWPLVPVYLGVWIALTCARVHSAAGLRAWAGGFVEGLRLPCGGRRPMRWRTVWRMTRLGRPPIV